MNDCPESVELSSWHDGEADLDLSAHVGRCSRCRETVDAYTRIDGVLQAPPPPRDDLKTRILALCECESSSAPVFRFVPLLRVAAALVVMLAIGYAVLVDIQTDSRTDLALGIEAPDVAEEAAPTTDDARSEGVTEVTLSSPRGGPEDTYTVMIKRGNELRALYGPRQAMNGQPLFFDPDIPRSRLVSVAGSMTTDEIAGASLGGPSILPRRVRHVWVVDDLDQGRREFLDILPDGALFSVCAGDEEGGTTSLCISVELGEEQLQELVNELSAGGWALVSSALPQPKENNRLLLTGETVSYMCELVASK